MVSMEQESLCPLIIQLLICSAAAALAANYIVPTCLLWQPTYQPARTHGEQNDHPSFLTLLSVTVSNFLQLLMVLTKPRVFYLPILYSSFLVSRSHVEKWRCSSSAIHHG
jgi:hypothetical protein